LGSILFNFYERVCEVLVLILLSRLGRIHEGNHVIQGSSNFLFLLVGWGFELRASCLQSRHSTTLAIPPVPHFVLVILEMGREGVS
jgi:hypothetical protein